MAELFIPGTLTNCNTGEDREVEVGYNIVVKDGRSVFQLLINIEWLECNTLSILSGDLSDAFILCKSVMINDR